MEMLTTPSVTAHLLHHRQTIFKGMLDYEKGKNITKQVSKLNYEYGYNFKDERVAELSENVNAFCLEVLKDLSPDKDFKNEERDSCVYSKNDSFSKQINEKLIKHFESTLYSFETKFLQGV